MELRLHSWLRLPFGSMANTDRVSLSSPGTDAGATGDFTRGGHEAWVMHRRGLAWRINRPCIHLPAGSMGQPLHAGWARPSGAGTDQPGLLGAIPFTPTAQPRLPTGSSLERAGTQQVLSRSSQAGEVTVQPRLAGQPI